jgi:Zn finger protein HypA/HybF involved in hydrogenase expression
MSDIFSNENPIVQIACNICKHFHRENMKTVSCDAFDSIPKEILSGDNKHTKPIEGQKNKIVYEPLK